MGRKPRTPKELAQVKGLKKTYSFSLRRDNVEFLASEAKAVEISLSDIIDEAIQAYIDQIKDSSKSNG